MVAPRMQKGGESDELLDDMGELLFDLFRGRLLPQLLFLRVWRRAHGPAASAAFSWARRKHPRAFGWCSYGAWTGYGRTRAGCGRRRSRECARAAGGRSFTVQLRHPNGVPGVVWRHRLFAYALLRALGRLWIVGLSQQRACGWRDCVPVPEQGVDLGRREHGSG